jgi:hypothetical protein
LFVCYLSATEQQWLSYTAQTRALLS